MVAGGNPVVMFRDEEDLYNCNCILTSTLILNLIMDTCINIHTYLQVENHPHVSVDANHHSGLAKESEVHPIVGTACRVACAQH